MDRWSVSAKHIPSRLQSPTRDCYYSSSPCCQEIADNKSYPTWPYAVLSNFILFESLSHKLWALTAVNVLARKRSCDMEVRIEDQLIIASFILFLSLFVSIVLTAGSFVHFPVLTLIKITHSYLKQHLIFILRSLNIADWNQVTHLKRCQKKNQAIFSRCWQNMKQSVQFLHLSQKLLTPIVFAELKQTTLIPLVYFPCQRDFYRKNIYIFEMFGYYGSRIWIFPSSVQFQEWLINKLKSSILHLAKTIWPKSNKASGCWFSVNIFSTVS